MTVQAGLSAPLRSPAVGWSTRSCTHQLRKFNPSRRIANTYPAFCTVLFILPQVRWTGSSLFTCLDDTCTIQTRKIRVPRLPTFLPILTWWYHRFFVRTWKPSHGAHRELAEKTRRETSDKHGCRRLEGLKRSYRIPNSELERCCYHVSTGTVVSDWVTI